jgi:shikimate dehydrogenase
MSMFRVGLIGKGIQASLTPAMHMAEGQARGFTYRYELLDLDPVHNRAKLLPELVADCESAGFAGLNITHPYKQAAVSLVEELSDDATALGAINTIVFKNGRRYGHNTDWWGFAESFRRGLPGADLGRVVQLGAGGAGAATAFAILRSGAEQLIIFDKDQTREEALAATMRRHFPTAIVEAGVDLRLSMEGASGLIHATPTGMSKYPGLPLDPELLRSSQWVSEIVYFPLATELLSQARRRGCRTLDGGGMAVFQAVRAFHLFTGVEPDSQRMEQHFLELTAGAEGRQLAGGLVG